MAKQVCMYDPCTLVLSVGSSPHHSHSHACTAQVMLSASMCDRRPVAPDGPEARAACGAGGTDCGHHCQSAVRPGGVGEWGCIGAVCVYVCARVQPRLVVVVMIDKYAWVCGRLLRLGRQQRGGINVVHSINVIGHHTNIMQHYCIQTSRHACMYVCTPSNHSSVPAPLYPFTTGRLEGGLWRHITNTSSCMNNNCYKVCTSY